MRTGRFGGRVQRPVACLALFCLLGHTPSSSSAEGGHCWVFFFLGLPSCFRTDRIADISTAGTQAFGDEAVEWVFFWGITGTGQWNCAREEREVPCCILYVRGVDIDTSHITSIRALITILSFLLSSRFRAQRNRHHRSDSCCFPSPHVLSHRPRTRTLVFLHPRPPRALAHNPADPRPCTHSLPRSLGTSPQAVL